MKIFILALLLSPFCRGNDSLFIEAEAFKDHGGWSTDSQFILHMGSAYLLAHGLGEPVKPATTTVTFPSTGVYYLHVRTKDWVAHWGAPGSPGRFQIIVDGTPARKTFGTEGAQWHWQNGGAVEINSLTTSLTIKDLTGFEGRCDALYFTKDDQEIPPSEQRELFEFRRKKLSLPLTPPLHGGYDMVVVGGGYSGLGAAISGARQGLKIALIHDRPVLGGNGSSEVQVWAMGGTQRGKYPHLGEIVDEFSDYSRDSPGVISDFVDDLKKQVVDAESNIDLYLNHFAFRTNAKDSKILSVDVVDTTTGLFKRIAGNLFCDSTGHGTIGAQAGAKFMMAEKGHLGMSNMWSMIQVDQDVPWPQTPWTLPLGEGDYPKLHDSRGPYATFKKAEWFWESGFDQHPIDDLETIRDWNFRANYGAFSHIKQTDKKAKLMWMAFIGGNRESRRLEGDIILTGDDIVARKDFPDGCVPTTWSIDLHYPRKEYMKGVAQENPFISIAVHDRKVDRQNGYPIPYRILYSKNVTNLFMAGRNVSVDRRALGTTRVMRTCGMMGEVVGKAAWIATTRNTTPRGVYENYLPTLIDLIETPGRARRDHIDGKIVTPPLPDGGLRKNPKEVGGHQIKGLAIDDSKTKRTGHWSSGNGLKPFWGSGYQYGSPPCSATFNIRVKDSGKYELRYYWEAHENRNTHTKLIISHANGEDEIIIDQTKRPKSKHFISLGTFEFSDVIPGHLKVSAETGGYLGIDAIELLKK